MGTCLRAGVLRVVIYTQDHPRPHVHVIGPDGQARVLLTDEGPVLMESVGLKIGQLRSALQAITVNGPSLRASWEALHGSDRK